MNVNPGAQDKPFIGHIGLGYWGKNILRNLHALNVLHTACDVSPEIVKTRKSEYPNVRFENNFSALIENPDIRAIVISTPAVTHYQLIKDALLAGKDVFVEKPLSLTVREGQELVQLAEQRGQVLMVGHILAYHPAVKKLKQLIAGGELGKINYIYSNRLNIGKLRSEENILWSFAPHDISVMLMLLEEEPVKVSAFSGDYVSKGIHDTTLTTLEFTNGVKGHIFVSWLHPFKEQKLIVVGTKAMVVFDDVSKEKLFLYPHTIQWKDGKVPVAQKADYQVIPFESGEPLKLELLHFVDCVNNRKTPDTDGREGLRVLKILEIAEQANQGASGGADREAGDARSGKNVFIHESAYVDDGVDIGPGSKIWHFSHVLKGSKLGADCILGQNVVIGPDAVVGRKCKIQNNVSLYKGVTLEDEVFCGPSCVFTNVYNPRAFIERKHEFLPTLVRQGATIGANATIVCGTTIGKYAVIGAGAVIKKDVPDHAVMAGVPAKQIGWACRCGTSLKKFNKKNEAVCSYCSLRYKLKKNAIFPVQETTNK